MNQRVEGSAPLELEDEIPLLRRRGKHRGLAERIDEALRKMKIGQSFFTPSHDYVNGHISRMAREANVKVATRKWKHQGVDGVRVWRVK